MCLGALIVAVQLPFASAADRDEIPAVIEFNRDVRPILSDNCFHCHGPDRNKREADLRLDTEEGLHGSDQQSGVVHPGRPDESELFRRLITDVAEEKMPPADANKTLSARDLEVLKRWIQQGAVYEGHWAFQPRRTLTSDELPAALASHPSEAIDYFIARRLEKNELSLADPADRITLLRRLHTDVTGLPPTPDEVDAFLADQSPDAWQKQVDRLLKSPHYGERMAMWWLDLVRYADTVGYHGDQEMSVSPFRDYVIDSFNANKPFDQFTIEQLAGDLFPEPTQEQRIASGYNRLGMMSAEGGVQPKEYLAKYIAERVRSVSGAWLGITMGCCECHNHKFDPFTTAEFYQFEAFFADIQERGLYSGADWGPKVKVPREDQKQRMDELNQQIAALEQQLAGQTPELTAAQEAWEKSQPIWQILKPTAAASTQETTLTIQDDLSVLASGANPATETYTIMIPAVPGGITAIQLEVLPDDSLPQKGPGRAGNGNFVLSEFIVRAQTGENEPRAVGFTSAVASYEQTGAAGKHPNGKWAIAAAIDNDVNGKKWGWAVMEEVGKPHYAVFTVKADQAPAEGDSLTIELLQNHDNAGHNIGRFRLSITTSPLPEAGGFGLPQDVNNILAVPQDQRTDEQRNRIAEYYRSIAPSLEPVRQDLAARQKARTDLDNSITTSLITVTVEPRMVRVLPRGNWMDDSGDEVRPGIPAALQTTSWNIPDDRRADRRDLARWMMAPDNPLTARVLVNRLWKIYFGAGLSRKLDDLGAQGEPPTHPLLLDYLASQLVESGWDVQQLIRSILLSRAYQQSSLASAELMERDPYNRLLARQGRFRIDAELVRDNALAISGLLVEDVGGRSVKPYQPAGYWAYLNFPMREWQNGTGHDLYRRGLYTHWQRQYLHPSLLAFDAPSREECTADRARSNTPLQSLALLNDPSYVEAARAFAEMILSQPDATTDSRLTFAFRRALSRPIRPDESAILTHLLDQATAEYTASPEQAAKLLSVGEKQRPQGMSDVELAAWTTIARTILNLHETITRY
ncbi:MAG: PSD1 domain-containing protein [Planctomycetaceae bacterium]|nr:PSD1 domain-containing protein [Planctomycetaceae bacterium]